MSIPSIASLGSQASVAAASSTAGSPQSARPAASQQVAASPGKVAQLQVASDASTSKTEQKQQVEAAVKAVKEFIQPMASNLEFNTDEETGQTVIKITDSSSGELIRQIPSEEMLEIAKALDRLQGLLVKQKA